MPGFKAFWKDMFGAMQELEAETPQAPVDPDAKAGDTGAPAEAVPGATAGSVEGNATQAQLAAAQAELKRHQDAARERITADASLFVEAAVTAEQILPADRDRVLQAYIEAAERDAAQPPASADVSRVAFVRWSIEQRAQHGLTRELLPQGQDAQALINRTTTPGAGEQPMTAERRKELLATTRLGKQVLAEQNGRAN